MTRRSIPAGAIGLALATLVFAASLWWGVERLIRQDEIAYSSTSTGGWLVVQAQVEHLRFLEALAAHAVAPDTVGRDRVQLRFDILISRMLPFHTGHEAAEVRAMPDVMDAVKRLEQTLHDVDPLVTRLAPGDAAGAMAIRERLAPFAAELNNLTRLVVVERTGAIVQGRIRDAARWVMAPFVGILLSAAWLVVLLARQIRQVERLRQSAQEAHASARASQDQLVEAIESISEGFTLFDKDDRLVLFNSKFCELYPLLMPHIRLGMTFQEMFTAAIESGQIIDGGNRMSDRMARHRSPRGAFEAQLADGRWVRIAERRTPDGGMVSVRTDITHLRQREAQLTESQDRLRALLEGAPDAMIVVDDKGILVMVNRRAEELFGYGKAELLGRKVEQLIPESLRAAHIQHRKAYLNQPSYRVVGAGVRDVNAMTKSGVEVPVEITLSPANTTNGRMVIASVRDISERRRTAETVWRQANYDQLTKLPNRRLLSDRLQRSVAQAHRESRRVALVFIDLDRFKAVNDSLGHGAGDELLRQCAERLTAAVRETDTVGRFGGDEFVVVLADQQRPSDAETAVRKMLDTLARPFDIGGQRVSVSGSAGIALYPDDASEPETLMRSADSAMYAAKEAGRNAYRFFTAEMTEAAQNRRQLEQDLEHAVERGELAVHYQPICDIETGQTVGAEALLRWRHPTRGLLEPEMFVPLAEDTGQILQIGAWAIHKALHDAQAWRSNGFPDVRISVNLSGRQLADADLPDLLRKELDLCGIDPDAVDLEITENTLMTDNAFINEQVARVHKLGMHLAIDDFGTGYASIGYLRRFPVRTIKVDRVFMHDAVTNPSNAALADAIIAMARSLNLQVVAEGIENRQQVEFLRQRNCRLAQGFLYGDPRPLDGFIERLKGHAPALSA